ncbi:unnamed protein product (macronuclear) [Paramecium tetraurelia]|uniref:EF-hand domain-containing protein n=1 Tax=Paramecium tetraurelia TaxID=5888 RepID=A0C0Q1_PARTE|nr:uncharacterized protein GSPATT00033844001 [Paramecium tetraurelia]CAK64368.1 unnamed protein product [Paramecium tetraurelia]|eukprot:XP_001431766.1 hypothetical protein (macronuclear) [Paramecium tetraurelia strain d4-2]
MGSVSSNPNADETGTISNLPMHLRRMELKFDITKEVNPNLKQLLHWSLMEIRQVYEQFQRRSTSPFIDKNIFCKIVPFSRSNASFIFDQFCVGNKVLSIYELICILTITAYTQYIHKVHFLYIVFDLDCSGNISLNELLIIFKSIILGYCKLTEAELPSYIQLEKFAKLMFLKSDIQVDNSLELSEIIEWLDNNPTGLQLFQMYEPKQKVQEPFEAFRSFRAYTEQEAENMLEMITKSNKNEYYMKSLNDQVGKRNKFSYMANTKSQQQQQIYSIQQQRNQSLPKIQAQKQLNMEEELEELNILEKALDQHQKKYDLSTEKPSQSLHHPAQNPISLGKRIKSQGRIMKNIIITKGCTLTRNEIFRVKNYFDSLSDNNKVIGVKDFTKAFQNKPHMKRVTASLYNYLDSKQKGFVTFDQLMLKLYPSLTKLQLEIINNWIKQYNEVFSKSSKESIELEVLKNNDTKQLKRKRVLPKSSMIRIKQIYDLIDQDNKGYISLEDLKKTFTYGFTGKEVEDLFRLHDLDKDGKLGMEDFIRIILPPDYVIEDEAEEQ